MSKNSLQAHLKELVDELVGRGVPLEQARREFEKQFIIACISANEGNLGRSANCLGIHRNTLRNKVEALGINVEVSRPTARRPARRSAERLSKKGRKTGQGA